VNAIKAYGGRYATRAAPKVMPSILLCWPTTSEANVVYMAVEVEPSRQNSVKFCCSATDGSRGAVWQNGVWHGSAYETKVCINPYQLHKMELNKQLQVPALLTAGRRDSGKYWQDSRAGPRTGLDDFIYLAGCTMFPHLPAPIWQL
jgi:hypothetical protein